MKSNLISAIAGWKSAALLALVAMVAAVAFSGVLSTTQTAEAATVPLAADDNSATAAPGDTVNIVVASAFARVSITDTGGASGSFVATDGPSVACSDDGLCDVDDRDANTAGRQNVADSVTVALKIDDDSGEGFILLSVGGLGATVTTKVITVSKATLIGSLDIKASMSTIAAADGTSTLTIEVKNASTPPAGLNGQEVSLITTLGSLECVSGTETQACSVTTADYDHDDDTNTAVVPGGITATLNGKGVEGTATITARLGTLTATVDVTMFGTAKNLTAEPEQGSVEIGGSVYVVLTVTDDAGNPVSGQMITPVTSPGVEIAGPGDDPVLVTTEKATAASGDSPIGVGYSKDKINAVTGNIPACGDDNTDTDADTGGLQETFGPNDGTGVAGEGTNDKGQCVVYVTAPDDVAGTPANEAATRGEHTLNFAISATVMASATIEVAGKPDSISTDAADTVEPGSVTEITVSVFDDDDVLVGITSVKVRKVGGDGLIEDEGDGGSEMTANGQSKFTFIAPSTPGTSEILITAGEVDHRVTLIIGDPPSEEPEAPPATWNNELVSGQNYVVWNGDDGADPSNGAADGVSAIWSYNTGSGSWDGYFPDAADVPGGNTLTSLSSGQAYVVIVD